jgi:hypothetical protein
MKHFRLAAWLCTVLASGAAHAQFGELLKNAVTNAASHAAANAAANATTRAVNGAIDGAAREASTPATQPAAGPAPQTGTDVSAVAARSSCDSSRKRKPLPPLGPRPANVPAASWPDEPACAYRFDDYGFPAGKAQAQAFEEAGRVPCSECAGGFSLDANAAGKLAVSPGPKKRFLERLVALQPGEKIEWQGARYRGTIVLAGEQPIGEFPCRQFHWTLTNKVDVVMAEREGLYCMWKYRSDDPVWHEVF